MRYSRCNFFSYLLYELYHNELQVPNDISSIKKYKNVLLPSIREIKGEGGTISGYHKLGLTLVRRYLQLSQ